MIKPGGKNLMLGQSGHNAFTSTLGDNSTFLDLSLGNWEINSGPWPSEKFDAVVCTRCAYFASDAQRFIDQCKEMLRPGGVAFIDWGLGDHWRFDKFKVGWVDGAEHEHSDVGDHRSLLSSAFWMPSLEKNEDVHLFKEWIEKHGYTGDLTQHVLREVPSVASDESVCRIDCLSLWPEKPQLYVLTQFRV
jgi:SAM-dependent methyltransferase